MMATENDDGNIRLRTDKKRKFTGSISEVRRRQRTTEMGSDYRCKGFKFVTVVNDENRSNILDILVVWYIMSKIITWLE